MFAQFCPNMAAHCRYRASETSSAVAAPAMRHDNEPDDEPKNLFSEHDAPSRFCRIEERARQVTQIISQDVCNAKREPQVDLAVDESAERRRNPVRTMPAAERSDVFTPSTRELRASARRRISGAREIEYMVARLAVGAPLT